MIWTLMFAAGVLAAETLLPARLRIATQWSAFCPSGLHFAADWGWLAKIVSTSLKLPPRAAFRQARATVSSVISDTDRAGGGGADGSAALDAMLGAAAAGALAGLLVGLPAELPSAAPL